MQIPIIKGVYTGGNADYKTLYPLNMMPVIQETGISSGYLRPVEGIVEIGEGPGKSRGAINWNGVHYRVMGSSLCSISAEGVVTSLGDVGNDEDKEVTMDYSFDRLAITSAGSLFYYYIPTDYDPGAGDPPPTGGTQISYDPVTGYALVQVTDPQLGVALTMVWVDGYFMTTDGEFIVVTEINDPYSIPVTKYGSSEIDPDPVVSLLKLRNEIYAVNRYTIEVFNNIGGDNFPFQRVTGAQIQRGAVGTYAAAVYENSIAFVGSGRSEAPAIYLGVNGQTQKISSREIDEILIGFTEEELSSIVLETLNDKSQAFLWIRLPDRTLVYDLTASKAAGEQIWYIMSSGTTELQPYRARDVIFCYDKWQAGDTTSFKVGVLDNALSTHYGAVVPWEFGTSILYNESRGALVKSLELVALTGRATGTVDPVISTSYSLDGRSWSQDRSITIGAAGEAGGTLKRLLWWRQGSFRNMRIQRFQGDSNAYLAVSRLEVNLEPLGV